jgi:hypothetical protein
MLSVHIKTEIPRDKYVKMWIIQESIWAFIKLFNLHMLDHEANIISRMETKGLLVIFNACITDIFLNWTLFFWFTHKN